MLFVSFKKKIAYFVQKRDHVEILFCKPNCRRKIEYWPKWILANEKTQYILLISGA